MSRAIWCVLIVACETAEPPPRPPITPVPPDAAVVDVAIDTPAAVADLQCHWRGPKEVFEITTDVTTMTGSLVWWTTGRVPDRRIRYRAVPAGPAAFDLVFVAYEPGDYKRMWNAPAAKPREKLEVGKSVVARVFVAGGEPRIVGVDVDLHTGMITQYPDHSYPCNAR